MSKQRIRTSESVQLRARELRQQMTAAEAVLWDKLRDRRLGGYKFRRQAPIGRCIADFFCPAANLVIELDGSVHANQVEYDAERTRWLEEKGYSIMRFNNQAVEERLDEVLQQILEACQRSAKGKER